MNNSRNLKQRNKNFIHSLRKNNYKYKYKMTEPA